MSNTTEQTALPTESLAESYQLTTPHIPHVCKPGDTECLTRWIQAFGDCD